MIALDTIGATVTGPLTIKSDGVGRADLRRRDARQAPLHASARPPRPQITAAAGRRDQPRGRRRDRRAAARRRSRGCSISSAKARNQLTSTGSASTANGAPISTIRGSVATPEHHRPRRPRSRHLRIRRPPLRARPRHDPLPRRQPIDPLLDISAEAGIQGLSATIHVTGTGLTPEISFTSTPALPEDELLVAAAVRHLDHQPVGARGASARRGGGQPAARAAMASTRSTRSARRSASTGSASCRADPTTGPEVLGRGRQIYRPPRLCRGRDRRGRLHLRPGRESS